MPATRVFSERYPLELEDVLRKGLRRVRVAAQRAKRDLIGARRASESELDAARVQRREGSVLFGDRERRVVGEHHAARAEQDRLRVRCNVGDEHRGRRRRDGRHVVMLGVPDPREAARLGELRDAHAPREGVGGRLAGSHEREVEE